MRVIGHGRYARETYPQSPAAGGGSTLVVNLTGDTQGRGPASDVPTQTFQLQSFAGPSTPPENGSWLQEVWYIDRQNSEGTSSDQNDGLTPQTALIHYAEAMRRLGTWSPTYPQGEQTNGVVFVFLSDDVDEDIVFTPVLNMGALVNFYSVARLVATTTIANFAAKSAAGAVTAQLGASATRGTMLVNASRGNSVAWVDSVNGATQTITQPFAPSVTVVPPAAWWLGGANGSPAENNAWANGDTVQVFRPAQVNIVHLEPKTVGVWPPTVDGMLMMVGNIWIPDLTGFNANLQSCRISTQVRLTQCRVDAIYEGLGDPNNGVNEQVFNCWMPGGGYFRGCGVYGGALNAAADNPDGAVFSASHGSQFTGDIIVHQTLVIGSGSEGANSGSSALGGTCLTGTLSVLGPLEIETFNYPNNTLYGTYTVNVCNQTQPGQLYYANTAQLTFLGTPTLQMNGHATAQGLNRSTGQFFFGVALTPANLDGATPTGFGGIAFSNDLVSVYARMAAL